MMHSVKVSDLTKPSTDAFHDFPACFQASSPVGLPFEEIAWVEGVGSQFEETAEPPGWRGWPEGEFLHERGSLRCD